MSLAYMCDNTGCYRIINLPLEGYDLDDETTKARWVTVHSIEIGYKTYCSTACVSEGLKDGVTDES